MECRLHECSTRGQPDVCNCRFVPTTMSCNTGIYRSHTDKPSLQWRGRCTVLHCNVQSLKGCRRSLYLVRKRQHGVKVYSPEFDFTHLSEGNGYSVCGVRGGQGPKEIVNRNRKRLFLRLYFGDTGPASQWWGRNRWAQCLHSSIVTYARCSFKHVAAVPSHFRHQQRGL